MKLGVMDSVSSIVLNIPERKSLKNEMHWKFKRLK
jgi:hypothetical protein